MDQQRITAEVTEHKEKQRLAAALMGLLTSSPSWWGWRWTSGWGGYNTDLRDPAGGNDLKCLSSCSGRFLCLG